MQIRFNQEQRCWRLSWDATLLRLWLTNGILLADFFGPAAQEDAASQPRGFADPLLATRSLANVQLARTVRM